MSAFDPITYRRGEVGAPCGYWTAPDVAARVFQHDDLVTRVTVYPGEPALGTVKLGVHWPWWMRAFPRSERAFRLDSIYAALAQVRPATSRLIVVAE